MLFRKKILDGLRNGTVTLAFRRWRRPTVRQGSTLLTPVGQLHIGSISLVALNLISEVDAQQAGYELREALLLELNRREVGQIYRIELGPLVPDPRIVLRNSVASGDELQKLQKELQRLDASAGGAPWTVRILEIINSHSGIRAGELCKIIGQEKIEFKRNVRKLKNLGLTESLETGYRLSSRGTALLEVLRFNRRSNAT
jgi:hypothetical protein